MTIHTFYGFAIFYGNINRYELTIMLGAIGGRTRCVTYNWMLNNKVF